MRRSAVDIGPKGFDDASGWGLLNIPRALAYPTPPRDPQEPNEHPAEIEPHGLFATGTQPLTRPGHLDTILVAHLDRSEDPVDLYRAWAPAGMALRISATRGVELRVLSRVSKKAQPLAVARNGIATYRNTASHGAYVYVELQPTARSVEYRLHLTAARP
jgi:hypothetical protein